MSIKHFAAGVLATLALNPLSALADSVKGFKQKGVASYYADRFQGHKTASGTRFDQQALTAAHRTLPLGSKVRVTNLGNGSSVVVEINDRGPYVKRHFLDLSKRAAKELRMLSSGVAQVQLEVLVVEGDS